MLKVRTLVIAALIAIGLSACQDINVQTEQLLPPLIDNGRPDRRFTAGQSDTIVITDLNYGSTVFCQIDGGSPRTYTLPFVIAKTSTVKAWCAKTGLRNSATASKTFTLVNVCPQAGRECRAFPAAFKAYLAKSALANYTPCDTFVP